MYLKLSVNKISLLFRKPGSQNWLAGVEILTRNSQRAVFGVCTVKIQQLITPVVLPNRLNINRFT